MRATTTSLVTLLTAIALTSRAPAQDHRVDKLLERADAATKKKDPGRAVSYLKLAYRLDPKRDGLREKLGKASLQLGISFLDGKRTMRARDAFRDGTRWAPKNPGLWLGLGEATRRLRDMRSAEDAFRKVLTIEPKSFDALYQLGDLCFDQRRYREAVKFLERARKADPSNRATVQLLEKAIRDGKVEQPFKDFQSEHFLVRFNGKRRGLQKFVPQILRFVERSWGELAEVLGHRPSEKIVMLLYTNTEFRKLNRTADWVRAYYDGKIRVPLDSWATQKNRVQKTIRHELCHAFLYSIEQEIAPWIHEGFAQWFEGIRVDQARDVFRNARMVKPDMLRRPFVQVTDAKVAGKLYAQSLVLFVHLRENGGPRKFRHLLAQLPKSQAKTYAKREEAALRAVYGKGIRGLLSDVAARHRLVAPGR